MISIVAVHGMPNDPQAFDSYYNDVHTPLVQRIPGVINIRYGHVLQRADAESANYLICDTYFADEASLQTALDSPEMADALADVPNFSTGGVTIFFADVADYAPISSASPEGNPT
jgi:uncharacterized protein (TIGR02118 family)